MTRGYSSANQQELTAQTLHQILMAKLEFDTPVYIHTGVGSVVFDGNTYLGVGDFGSVTGIKESEFLRFNKITLNLSGIDSAYVDEALNSSNYGDLVTLYEGFRSDDGTLVDNPEIVWAGTVEYANLTVGSEAVVSLVCTHELAFLSEIDGSRFTDEDQRTDYPDDGGLKFIADVANTSKNLVWAGGPVPTGQSGGRPRSRSDADRDGIPDDQR